MTIIIRSQSNASFQADIEALTQSIQILPQQPKAKNFTQYGQQTEGCSGSNQDRCKQAAMSFLLNQVFQLQS